MGKSRKQEMEREKSALQPVIAPGASLPGDDRRRYRRFAVRTPAKCIIGPETIEVTIVDVSEGGMGLDSALPVEQGSEFKIVIADAGEFRARLAWKNAERCGLELLPRAREISAAAADELAGWLKRVEEMRGR